MNENVWPLILLGGGLLAFLLVVSFLSKNYSLNNFKNKTVGDGQHGTARWATPKEIHTTYHVVPFRPRRWRKGEELPTVQGIILGSMGGRKRRAKRGVISQTTHKLLERLRRPTAGKKEKRKPKKKKSAISKIKNVVENQRDVRALVDSDDIHCLMIGASGVGKTAYFLYANLEYASASGMSYLALDTKGDLARNYRFVFADTKTQWTYRIDAVLGTVLEKQQKEIVATDFISLEEAKEIALKDAGLDEATQKIVFTREELNRNSGKPCYILEFYTAKKQYSYKVDAKDGSILEAYHFILLADAKKIALDDAGVSEKVTFTEETLVAGGIKSPYYSFAFESDTARWTYKIDAVLGSIMDKTYDKIVSPAPEFIGLEKAKQIALKDAGLDETAQKIVFTREELSRNSGKPCYILEFYTDKCAYSYKVDAVSGEIIGKKTEWFSRQESETVPDTSQNSDSKQRRGN